MTREKAIRQLEGVEMLLLNRRVKPFKQAVLMAIDVLRERDALLAEIKGMCHLCRHYNYGIGYKPCDNCDGGHNFEWRGAQAVTGGHQLETVTNRNGLTNADHIRSMTDEELAKWVTEFVELVLEDNGLDDKYRLDPNFETNLLDKLKQPYKEDT